MNIAKSDAPMSVVARPSLDELLDRAAALRPTLAERASETEANRRVSSETMGLLAEAGLLSLCRPAAYGGYEFGPSALVRLGYELGQACGSTAWCAGLVNSNSWFGSYWPLRAQDDLWAERPENVLAAPLAPTGKATQTEGGYHVWGRWPYASNCENSDWSIISAMVPEHDGVPSGGAWFLTPMSTLAIDADTWHVAGMQGTGSKTLYADQPIFVPEHRMIRLNDVNAVTTPGTGIEDNPLARFGFATFGATALIGAMLGMAQGALDWFVENMRSKIRPGATTSVAERPFAQARAGRAAVDLDAALTLLLNDLAVAEEQLFGGATLDTSQRIRIRRDIGFAARQAVGVVNELFAAAGASAAELSKPIQRFWRDVNAAAGHVSLDEEAIMAMTGQHLFGLTPVGLH